MSIRLRGKDGVDVALELRGQGRAWTVADGSASHEVEVLEHDGTRIVFAVDGVVHRAQVRVGPRDVRVVLDGRESVFLRQSNTSTAGSGHAADAHEPLLRSPVPGRVLKVNVEAGATIHAGDVLLVIEAMKMETPIVAPADGKVVELHVEPGALIDQDQELVTCSY